MEEGEVCVCVRACVRACVCVCVRLRRAQDVSQGLLWKWNGFLSGRGSNYICTLGAHSDAKSSRIDTDDKEYHKNKTLRGEQDTKNKK